MKDFGLRQTEPQSPGSPADPNPPILAAAGGLQTRTDASHLPPATAAVAALKRTRFKWLERTKRFVRHPLTQLIVAIILIVTSLIEASETFVQDFYNARLRAAHGLMLVGIVQVLAAIPDLVEGLERYLESAKEHGVEPSSPPDEPTDQAS